ncbi:MAG: helix-turn-helix transcriptional regulator [Paludibacterium sp.]|uniref:ArsR/SmtB family transcription factor n=1 Tax=Paludibacterium sp. TaxID=1917523 RepID=UPI0025DE980E|nr:metalloregulator ArsR/SmtB family transcription factor [Paludibacterium sp.]MBV8046699.1 helix-turn-helix transcriptional regulator [Paludibacterium sp.]MBV8647296.1 helix-turn-helix transcriptional regulator [Paludibacterium sp.]
MSPSSPDALFSALADPTRRAIFQRLSQEGELTVRALTDQAGVSQPAVSKHLAVLKRAGLVNDRHAGRETHYRVQIDGLAPLIDWVGLYAAFWKARLDSLEDLLQRMDN